MRKKGYKGRCEKRTLEKCTEVCRTYDNIQYAYAILIDVSKEQLILTLLPRTTGKFTRKGIIVNGLRYKHDKYVEQYLTGKEVIVAYNPECVSGEHKVVKKREQPQWKQKSITRVTHVERKQRKELEVFYYRLQRFCGLFFSLLGLLMIKLSLWSGDSRDNVIVPGIAVIIFGIFLIFTKQKCLYGEIRLKKKQKRH